MFRSNQLYLKLYDEIAKLKMYNEKLIIEKMAVTKKNSELERHVESSKSLIKQIEKIATSNSYRNERATLGRIKEILIKNKIF